MLKKMLILLLTSLLVCSLTACERRGSVQRLGEKVDTATEAAQDTINPKRPVEKVGRNIDKALNTQSSSVSQAR